MPQGFFSLVNRRVVRPESLDTVPPFLAHRNLRDLVRINRWLGGHRSILQVFETLARPTDRFTVLDVGAASGDVGKKIRKKYRNAIVVSLDHRIRNLREATGPRLVGQAAALP